MAICWSACLFGIFMMTKCIVFSLTSFGNRKFDCVMSTKWIFRFRPRISNSVSTGCSLLLGDSWNYMPPILVLSSAKRIATQIEVIEKINGRRYFILRGFVCHIIHLSKELPVQSKPLKHKNKVWKLFRIKNEDNGVVPVPL